MHYLRTVDGIYETEWTPYEEICNSHCINCGDAFDGNKFIMWVRLRNTHKVIWWHTRQYNNSSTDPCGYEVIKRTRSEKLQQYDKAKEIKKKHEQYIARKNKIV